MLLFIFYLLFYGLKFIQTIVYATFKNDNFVVL